MTLTQVAPADYNTRTTRYLSAYVLITCILAGIAWVSPGTLAIPTNLGTTELFFMFSMGYLVLGGLLFVERFGIRSAYILNALLILICIGCLYHLIVQIALVLPSHKVVWDDALMFWRYIYNFKTHGIVAWNVADGPAYGATELLHLGVALLTSYLQPDSPHTTMLLASLFEGFAFIGAVTVMVWRVARLGSTGKLVVLTLIYIGLAAQTESLRFHFITGMGTMSGLTHLTIYIMLARWNETAQTPRSRLITGVWGGIAYYARPDLMLFSVIVPGVLWLGASSAARRGNALRLLGITLITGLALFGLAWLGLGSPVPLAFFVKSTNLYGQSYIYVLTARLPGEQLEIFLNNNLFLLLCIGAGCLAPRRTLQQWQGTGVALVIAAFAYTIYFRFFVLQMMYFYQRFYYPVLPVFIYLAVGGLSVLEVIPAKLPRWLLSNYGQQMLATGAAWVIVLVVFFFPTQLPLAGRAAFDPARKAFVPPAREFYAKDWSKHWFEIWAFSQVSPTLVVASTEVGIPAVLNPEWYVYDLSGLNNTQLALHGFSVDDFLAKKPDLIYMPWREYTLMHAAIIESSEFQQQYTLYNDWDLHSPFEIAVRIDSPYYAKIVKIIELGALKRQPRQK